MSILYEEKWHVNQQNEKNSKLFFFLWATTPNYSTTCFGTTAQIPTKFNLITSLIPVCWLSSSMARRQSDVWTCSTLTNRGRNKHRLQVNCWSRSIPTLPVFKKVTTWRILLYPQNTAGLWIWGSKKYSEKERKYAVALLMFKYNDKILVWKNKLPPWKLEKLAVKPFYKQWQVEYLSDEWIKTKTVGQTLSHTHTVQFN